MYLKNVQNSPFKFMDIKEEKAKEYANKEWKGFDLKLAEFDIKHNISYLAFKDGFEAGKQEERKEIVEKVKELVFNNFPTATKEYYKLMEDLENLSK